MFASLNRFISRLDGEPNERSNLPPGSAGFQCLRNKNPDIPIEPWFDFIVGINSRQIDNPNPGLFATEVRNCAGGAVNLTIWSAKGQVFRDLHLPIPSPNPTLGLTLQWTPLNATHDVWHILEVIPHSPADQAGLLPYGDYIIGTPEGMLRGEGGLGELVEDYLARPLRLHVYNHEYGVVREVTITPARGWGGEGALGCMLGYGALHRIPLPLEEPPNAPGETMFETFTPRISVSDDRTRSVSPSRYAPTGGVAITPPIPTGSNQYNLASPAILVPAAMDNIPSLLPTGNVTGDMLTPTRATRKIQKRSASPGKDLEFDEYWKESEKKSKENDFVPGKGARPTPPPPPPKAAGTMSINTQLPLPPPSGGEPRQTRSPHPILDDDDDIDSDDEQQQQHHHHHHHHNKEDHQPHE